MSPRGRLFSFFPSFLLFFSPDAAGGADRKGSTAATARVSEPPFRLCRRGKLPFFFSFFSLGTRQKRIATRVDTLTPPYLPARFPFAPFLFFSFFFVFSCRKIDDASGSCRPRQSGADCFRSFDITFFSPPPLSFPFSCVWSNLR